MPIQDIDLTGKQLGNYKILGKLGVGGMATVYKAHEMSLSRVVALKVLKPQLSEDLSFIKRFHREAKAVAQLNHPNIVQIFAIGEEKGQHYFAMEYVKGKPLNEIMNKNPINPPEAIRIVKQVTEGLGAAHKAGLVHRDIKPSNILIDQMGNIKITDFGIARIADANTKLTQDGSFLGTPEYVSPEVCAGKQADNRSDLYSLGVTLYEMLTGKTPFKGDTPVNTLVKIAEGKFLPINQVNPNIPPAVQYVVEKMMRKNREERYQTADELLLALDSLDTEALSTQKIMEAGLVIDENAAGRNHRRNIFIVIIIVMFIGGSIYFAWFLNQKEKSKNKKNNVAQVAQIEVNQPDEEPEDSSDIQKISGVDNPSTAPSESVPVEKSLSQEVSGTPKGENLSSSIPSQSTVSPTTGTSRIPDQSTSQVVTNRTAKPASPQRKSPKLNTIIITPIGDDSQGDLVSSLAEKILIEKGFRVIDSHSINQNNVSMKARNRLVISTKLIATNTLQYYGNSSEQYTVAVTMKVVSLVDGGVSAGPVIKTVKYTSINVEDNMKETITALTSQLLPQLQKFLQ